MRIVVLEIGRPIAEDVIRQFGVQPYRIVSYPRQVKEDEYRIILREAYKAIREAASGGEEVILILSGPLALAFQLGQIIGLNHFNIKVYQFSEGRYKEVPPIKREDLF
ncbi:MAG: SAVED domain-containing protein [Desulfurococcaceae archaeon]